MNHPEQQDKTRCWMTTASFPTRRNDGTPNSAMTPAPPRPPSCRLPGVAFVLLAALGSGGAVADDLTPRTILIDPQVDVPYITSQYYGREQEILNEVATRLAEVLNEYWELPWQFEPHPPGDRQKPRLIAHLSQQQGDWYFALRTVDQLGNVSNPGSMLRRPVYLAGGTKRKPQPDQLGRFLKEALKHEIIERIYGGVPTLRNEFRIMPVADGRVLHPGAQPTGTVEGVVLLPFTAPFQPFRRSVFKMCTATADAPATQVELTCEGTGTPIAMINAPNPAIALCVRHVGCFPDPLPVSYTQLRQQSDVFFIEFKPALGPVGSVLH